MRVWGLALVLVIGACADEKPAERRRSTTAENEVSQTGGMDPERNDATERVFARKANDLQACWTEEYDRTKNRKWEDELTVQVMISASGKPEQVKVIKSTQHNADVEKCVEKTVKEWGFPEGQGTMPYVRAVHLGAQF